MLVITDSGKTSAKFLTLSRTLPHAKLILRGMIPVLIRFLNIAYCFNCTRFIILVTCRYCFVVFSIANNAQIKATKDHQHRRPLTVRKGMSKMKD